MRLLLYEYCVAVGLGASPDDPAHSLFVEGQSMLKAVTRDFQRLSQIDVIQFPTCTVAEELACFVDHLSRAEAALIIAPEFDSLLESRCEFARQAGVFLLNCGAESLALGADKFRLAELWTKHGVPTPATRLASDRPASYPCVWKPRYGAGSTATRVIRDAADTERYWRDFQHEPLIVERIEQPWIPGVPVSVSVLCGPKQRLFLPPCRQLLSAAEDFKYHGGELPLPEPWRSRASNLARRALAPLPDCCGWVGVDLILGPEEDGSLDCAIEVNPRLTTSYLGVTALCHANVAECLLGIARGESVADPTWSTQSLRFRPTGEVSQAGNNL